MSKVLNFSRVLGLAACLMIATDGARAASYYVDYASGSDSNAGTSTNAAWKHCPGDLASTGNSAAATLSPGDTVFFKGGVTYVMTASSGAYISLNWAGAVGSPITYDGNSAGTWGTGPAVLTDNYSSNHPCAFTSGNSISNLVFRNFFIGPMGGAATLPSDPTGTLYAPNGLPPKQGNGITTGGSMNGVVIDSCTFSNLGYYGSTFPLGNSSLAGGAISSYGCNGLLVTNCTLTRMRDAIYLNNPGLIANLTIAGCTISQIEEWGITMNTGVNACLSNVYICNCLFTNVDQNYATWGGYGGPPHRDTIFSFGAEGCNGNCALLRNVADTNVCIYNNIFVDTLGYIGGSAVIWFEDNASVNIYNNLFINTQQANAAVQLTEPSTNSLWRAGVYNNTFYLSDYSMCLSTGPGPNDNFFWPISTSDHSTMVDVRNNIFYEWSGTVPYNNSFDYTINSSSTTVTNNVRVDYNLYHTGQTYAGQMVYGYWPQYIGYLMAGNAATQAGWDTHSVQGNPLFVNPGANDFRLQSTSPVIGKGVNLSSLNLPGLNADMNGVARPVTGNWTLGAYQTAVGMTNAAPPPPPTGLHIIAN